MEPPLIVLVEDNEANVMTLSSYLQARGYRVLAAKPGLETIALVQSVHSALVLIAVHLPGLNELEVIQQIRQDLHLVDLPIIAILNLATDLDRDRCFAAGATDCISKPIKFKQLTDMIQRHLAHLLVH